MSQRIYQVDAFTDSVFKGNPAAVCPLEDWLSEDIMQKIALENNLAETAFYVKQGDQYQIRWFTPAVEVDLCGHATLASGYVLFNHEQHPGDTIKFLSPRSGELTVAKKGDLLTLNFPADPPHPIELTQELTSGFDIPPRFAYKGRSDYLLIYDNEEEIGSVTPDINRIAELKNRGVIISAPGNQVDFVSRFFAPYAGINEDPVTGSAHTTLTPYWAEQLGKNELTAIQLSARKGYLQCKYLRDRVEISGNAKLYLKGEIYIA